MKECMHRTVTLQRAIDKQAIKQRENKMIAYFFFFFLDGPTFPTTKLGTVEQGQKHIVDH